LVSTLFLVLFSYTVANDFEEYAKIHHQYQGYKGHPLTKAISEMRFEPGFAVLYYYLSNFLSATNSFFILAIPAMTIKYFLFLKYLRYPLAAWSVYVMLFLPANSSQLRSSLATTIIIYILLSKTSNLGYVFTAIFACMFHYIGVIILLIRLYKHLFFALIFIALTSFFFEEILTLLSNQYFKIDYYTSSNPLNVHVNYLSTTAAAHLLLSLYCLIGWKGFNDMQKKGAFLILFGILLYFIFGYKPEIAHRIREISILGIFPLIFLIKVKFTYAKLLAFIGLFYMILYNCVIVIRELISILSK
jgi:hypothetical protein